jgi:hypothetical protein
MAALHKSCATLRLFGDSLNPEEITRLLGCPPSTAFTKGQIRYRTTLYKTGGWLLEAADREPADLDAQVVDLLTRVSQDLAVWSNLSKQYDVDLFCGFFMEETDEGLEISTHTMKMLSERGIKLAFCIYAPTKDVQPTDPCPCTSGKTYAECCAPKIKAKTKL